MAGIEERAAKESRVPPSFVCFSIHELRLSDITLLYLRIVI